MIVLMLASPILIVNKVYAQPNTFTVSNGQNLTWTSSSFNLTFAWDRILIQSGGKLTIVGCTLNMAAGGRIIIEANAEFNVQSSTIQSSFTGNNWDGIYIEGQPTLTQYPWYQGVFRISNSTVKDADVSIRVEAIDYMNNPNTIVWSKTGGGIIYADNTIFKDCNTGHLVMYSYKNIINGVERNNVSYFSNCMFKQNKEMSATLYPKDNRPFITTYSTPFMITLWDIKGVRFLGCDFFATYPRANIPNGVTHGYHLASGIFTQDATVIVQDIKDNSLNVIPKKGTFYSLNQGIANYYNGLSDDIAIINNNNFRGPASPIQQNGGMGSSIYRNNFYIDTHVSTDPEGSGLITFNYVDIFTDNATQFTASENLFTTYYQTNSSTFSGSNCTIFNNSQRNLSPAYYTSKYLLNQHRFIKNGSQTQENNYKLDIACNDYNNSPNYSYQTGAVILNPYSVSYKLPSFGNCDNDVRFYHNKFGNVAPNYMDINNFSTVELNKPYLAYAIETYKPVNTVNMTVTDCNIWQVDPNNQQGPNDYNCTNPFPAEPARHKPQPAFPKSAYYQLKNDVVVIKGILQAGGLTQTQVDQYNNQVITGEANLADMRSEIMNYYQHMYAIDDTTQNYLDSLITFLQYENTIEANKILLAIYVNHQRISDAQNIIGAIPGDNQDNIAYKSYFNLLISLATENKNIFQLSESQFTAIRTMAYGNTTSAPDAQGILAMVYGEQVGKGIEPVPDQNNANNSGVVNGITSQLIVYPNPSFSQNIYLNYTTTSSDNNFVIKVYDFTGNLITTKDVEGNTGEIMLTANNFTTGLYVAQLVTNGGLILDTFKFNFVQ
ncbi:MAG: T9SS type A sorting domain-containing protein [Bacteroidota bacterium]